MPHLAWWLLLGACGLLDSPRGERSPNAATPVVAAPEPATTMRVPEFEGPERVRVSTRSAVVGRTFDWPRPLTFELRLPPGTSIAGRGLPREGDKARESRDGGSLVEVQFPVHRGALTDEERGAGAIGILDAPRYCPVRGACEHDDDEPGRWHGMRIRTVDGEETISELDLASPLLARIDPMKDGPGWVERDATVLGVWLPRGAPPLDEHDRLLFGYVGALPLRATQWLPERLDGWRVRARYRAADARPECPSADPACWTLIDPLEIQDIALEPKPPATLRVIAPMDVTAGEPFVASVILVDRHGNPSPADGKITLVDEDGEPLGKVVMRDAWRRETTLTIEERGPISIRATSDLDVVAVHHWTMVSAPGRSRRLAGDLHAHTGVDGTLAFQPTWTSGDHRAGFTTTTGSLAYMRQVAGYDFGAISEHSVSHQNHVSPAALDPAAFGPGRPCEIEADESFDQPDWWSMSQTESQRYDDTHGDFLTFPAYEWHGRWRLARLHRVVAFRDHDPNRALPMLPGRTGLRRAQCLFRFLESSGRTPTDTLILAHMMQDTPKNKDWELTYRAGAPWDDLVSADAAERWQRGVEVYSARNGRISTASHDGTAIAAFEGPDTQEQPPWTLRHGWRDLGAVIGVVGGSDDHAQMPGSDELPIKAKEREHRHDPGGTTFVIVDDTTGNQRNDLFDAMHRRATYATSGPRAWLDFRLDLQGDEVIMGQERVTEACSATSSIKLMVGRNIRELQLWGVQLGEDMPYQLLADGIQYRRENVRLDHTLDNPATQGTETWMYYVRAHLGPEVDGKVKIADHQDAVWSSPIWVTWKPGCR